MHSGGKRTEKGEGGYLEGSCWTENVGRVVHDGGKVHVNELHCSDGV